SAPVLLSTLLARNAVAFAGETAEASLAVGKVFLAVDQPILGGRCSADDQVATAEVIAQLILDFRLLIVGITDAADGNTALVVHHVQAIVLFCSGLADFLPLVILKDAVNVDCTL